MSIPKGDSTQGLKSWHSFVKLPEFPVDPAKTALIVIDLTLQQAFRNHGVCRRIAENGLAEDLAYFVDRMEQTVVPNVRRLIDGFHARQAPVVFTRCVSLRGGRSCRCRRDGMQWPHAARMTPRTLSERLWIAGQIEW